MKKCLVPVTENTFANTMEILQVYITFLGCGTGYYSVYPVTQLVVNVKSAWKEHTMIEILLNPVPPAHQSGPPSNQGQHLSQLKKFNYFGGNNCAQFNLEGEVSRVCDYKAL